MRPLAFSFSESTSGGAPSSARELFYESRYENLVLAGRLKSRSPRLETPFLFASGIHDKGFPRGDGEPFSDVLLAIADGSGGYRCYAVTDRVLPGLQLDVAAGTYRYQGPISALDEGSSASRSEARSRADERATLRAEIGVEFEATAADIVSFPFPARRPVLRRLSSRLIGWLWRALPGTNPPGIHIRFQATVVRSGFVRIHRASGGAVEDEASMNAGRTGGECERGTLRNLRRPRLRYEYRCTVDPGRKTARVRIVAGASRADGRVGRLLDAALARIGSVEVRHEGNTGLRVTAIRPRRRDPAPSRPGATVLELGHDRHPTAVLRRRIVEVEESGESFLALEEDVCETRQAPAPPASSRPAGHG